MIMTKEPSHIEQFLANTEKRRQAEEQLMKSSILPKTLILEELRSLT